MYAYSTLEERIEFVSTTSAVLMAQLSELSLMRERLKQAQTTALKSIRRKSGPPRRTGRLSRKKPTR